MTFSTFTALWFDKLVKIFFPVVISYFFKFPDFAFGNNPDFSPGNISISVRTARMIDIPGYIFSAPAIDGVFLIKSE